MALAQNPTTRGDHPIGLREVAERLGVHYMTAYRYVRTGRLAAVRSQGVWMVDPADLVALAEAPGTIRESSRPRAARQLTQLLVQGDDIGAYSLIQEALGSWAGPVEVHTEMLVPALRDIGDRWALGQLTVADEHRATSVALRLLGRLGPIFVARGRHRGMVVVGSVAGDRHSMPTALAADLLRLAGFLVIDLGADTPAQAFAQSARSADRLVAVAIAATMSGMEGPVAEAVAAVRAEVGTAFVVVGGRGLARPETAHAVGADRGSGGDARDLVNVALEREKAVRVSP